MQIVSLLFGNPFQFEKKGRSPLQAEAQGLSHWDDPTPVVLQCSSLPALTITWVVQTRAPQLPSWPQSPWRDHSAYRTLHKLFFGAQQLQTAK